MSWLHGRPAAPFAHRLQGRFAGGNGRRSPPTGGGRATLAVVSSRRPRHVTLSGDMSGDYVVLEERPDGSLVVAPESERHPVHVRRPTARRAGGGLLAALLP